MAAALVTLDARLPEPRWEMGLRGRRGVERHHDLARLAARFEACQASATDDHHNIVDQWRRAHGALPRLAASRMRA